MIKTDFGDDSSNCLEIFEWFKRFDDYQQSIEYDSRFR